ncbi:MAG: hypothetical protein JXM73_11180 [Anaerolineae bacterium]|nr:hypothetical protein [Anaerolineae bacterium]
MNKKHVGFDVPWPNLSQLWVFARKWLLPNPGTLVLMIILALAIPALAAPRYAPEATSTSTISYQGRLADSGGNPVTDYKNMIFRIYNDPVSGTPLWQEDWVGANAVAISDGLFNVMLGSLNPDLASAIEGYDELYLGIEVEYDGEMVPRVQLGSVPFSMQAMTAQSLSGQITTDQIADGAVTTGKMNIDASLNANWHDITNVDQLWAGGRIEMGVDGSGEGGEFRLASGTTGGWWVVDNYYGTLRAYHDASVYFTLDQSGNLWAAGTKSAAVRAGEFGQRKLYAVESADVRFIDEGFAHLKDSAARIDLDPVFIQTIEGQYLVHITPYGDASLFVSEVGVDYFVVKAHRGDPDVGFAWRLSATRKGYAGVRLEQVVPEGLSKP